MDRLIKEKDSGGGSLPSVRGRPSFMKRNTAAVFMVLGCGFWLLSEGPVQAAGADAQKWPDLFQKPYEHLALPDTGLKPVLQTADGKKIATKEAWVFERAALAARWLKQLGAPPAKPVKLAIRVHSREAEADHLRVLLSFAGEDGDRIRAYLLQPNDVKPGDKRPAVVVFHPTT